MRNTEITVSNFQDVATYLKAWRKDHNISQEDFSRFAKVQRTWYSKIERGEADNITLNSLLKLLEEMGCKLVIVDTHAQPVG
ncbi:helix-turn-helix transcriptional regulator [Flagellimonas halotolerans]|uniref:Helix-turn-helix transcriptional regulator n=1 Tax=Flagellimonas halotolerans TaxID=3112164 RepID=A0ABU6IU84_9FLAO|nr:MULTISPECIES: helix-turn-helix transcriptional regulator [unclassified Allomuricauda]MEC3966792.1 helix-turn-helix transcriptional regulator [Muricauda sp. SYSU M86414]MEC4266692.1 helix-turn-helix transcriptional regulator [Muricauda sp. SYSU M84420]